MRNISDNNWIQHAVQLAIDSVAKGGGPFGAVIVRNSEIIGSGFNQVTLNNDPTAHAEIMAIREACKTLQNFNLDGCTLYSSCEPCPMCLSAIYWAHISRVVYAASGAEAAQAGFDDTFIAREICIPHSQKSLAIEQHSCNNHTRCFTEWNNKSDKTPY
ncbi:MAG: guanine deaminase [Pseudomonadota bacterium]|nr:guanine deaminase [Pseudomonadota bacterium]